MWSGTVPGTAPERSSGTRRTAHSNPASPGHACQRSAAGALAGTAARLANAATAVTAAATSPALLLTFLTVNHWPLGWALLATFFGVVAFRGLIDVVAHWLIPRPSLWGSDEAERHEDAIARRRRWFWRGKFRTAMFLVVFSFLA